MGKQLFLSGGKKVDKAIHEILKYCEIKSSTKSKDIKKTTPVLEWFLIYF